MILDDIHRGIQKNRKRKRIGRGIGSGHGKTAGRGHKGAGSRAGFSMRPTFQGGQMSLVMRTPKRGFNNRWGKTVAVVNVADLEKAFSAGDEITPKTLVDRNIAKGRFDQLKVLGNGEISKKLTVSAHQFSQSAREKIEKAGGQAIVLPGKAPVGKQAAKKQVAAEKK